ncbi:MAG: protein glxC, partial [Rhizobiales bacterium]|nr:protein glxC [Hyphomicrobiales bacterium]
MAANTLFDLEEITVRQVNQALQEAEAGSFEIANPKGVHALACGLDAPLEVVIDGHVGYYCAGMNK